MRLPESFNRGAFVAFNKTKILARARKVEKRRRISLPLNPGYSSAEL